MSDINKKRLSAKVLLKDIEVFEVLKAIGAYNPSNATVTILNLTNQKTTMETMQEADAQSTARQKADRDNAVMDEKLFHANMLIAIDQVRAQFGEDSNEYQAVGRKKKSEHKSPKRKPKSASTPPTTK